MAIKFYGLQPQDCTALSTVASGSAFVYVVVDTEAEIPSYGTLNVGNLCFAKDTEKLYRRCNDAWEEIGSGVEGGAAWGSVTGTLANQTDLQTALDGKAASSHNHDATYEAKNANIQTHIAAAHAPSNAQKNSDITLAEIEAKLTGVISSHSHAGGADPWTYVQVNSGNDFTTTSATAVDVTGLAFTPVANTTYEFEALLLLRTATATVNPRAGLAWPTGGTDGVGMIEQAGATATAAHANAVGNINAALLIAVGGLLNNSQSWPVKIHGMFRAGASPSGTVRIQLASETAGTTVRIVARSFLKYRTLAF